MSDIQNLLDEAAIRKLHLRYCRGVDRLDWELVRACYHPEGIDDHGSYKGGVEGFIAWASAGLPRFASTAHFTGNQLVEVDGDRAWAEHYAVVFHRRSASAEAPEADLIVNVRYVDRLEKRGGEWRILNRVVIADSDRVDVIGGHWLDMATITTGQRDPSDASYASLPRQSGA
ncbi:MAG: nuclear transport factor 2 family protein [Sphingomicrobium sp.]